MTSEADDLPGLEEIDAPAAAPRPVSAKMGRMPDVEIILPGPPFGKGTIRSRVVTTKTGQTFAATFTDKKTRNYEAMLRHLGSQAMNGREPFDCALQVMVRAYYAIPQSWSQKKQDQAEQGYIRPTVKPDYDNVAKSCDGLNTIVWRDDAIIVDGFVRKFYSTTPRLHIQVFRWKPKLLV